MVTFLLITKSQHAAEDYIAEFIDRKSISRFDVIKFSTENLSIGIEDVRKFTQELYLKPFQSAQKLAVIYDSNKLTLEAQNAMLKTLEEPPSDTFIILVASNDLFLPTILSRCFIVKLESEETVISDEDTKYLADLYEKLRCPEVGARLKLAQQIGEKKEIALAWLEKGIYFFRSELLSRDSQDQLALVEILYKFNQTHGVIKNTNVNIRLTIEEMFLSLI